MTPDEIEESQLAVCARLGVQPVEAPADHKVGIAANVKDGMQPVNALRHPPGGDVTGWFIWAGGEPGEDPDFFSPLHVDHVASWCPDILPYLQLPPGYRVQIAPGYEDVWADPDLLNV